MKRTTFYFSTIVCAVLLLVISQARGGQGIKTSKFKQEAIDTSLIHIAIETIDSMINDGQCEIVRYYNNPPPCEAMVYRLNDSIIRIDVGCGDVSAILWRKRHYFQCGLVYVNENINVNFLKMLPNHALKNTTDTIKQAYFAEGKGFLYKKNGRIISDSLLSRTYYMSTRNYLDSIIEYYDIN